MTDYSQLVHYIKLRDKGAFGWRKDYEAQFPNDGYAYLAGHYMRLLDLALDWVPRALVDEIEELERLRAELTEVDRQEPELLDETSARAECLHIGNELHNLWCERQNDDELSDRIGGFVSRLWSLAKRLSASPTPPTEGDLVAQFRAKSPEHDRPYCEEKAKVDAAEAAASSDGQEEWRPIESAPREEGVYHARGIWVYDASSGKPLYFDVCAGYLRDGAFVSNNGDDVHGWDPDDYTHWHPLSEPPTADQRGGNGDA